MVFVDDNEELRRTSSDAFRQRGWTVTEAHDLRSALDAALTTKPHIIVTELLLPDVREYHFVRTLRSTVDHDVTIIGVTRLPAAQFAGARLAGFTTIFEKPIDVAELHRTLIERVPADHAEDTRPTTQMSPIRLRK